MNLSNCPYFELHKNLLSGMGLWPYQSKSKNLCALMMCVISSTITVIPTTLGLMSDLNKDFVIGCETITMNFTILGGLMQILVCYTRRFLIERLYKKIDADWQSITNIKELKILQTFSEEGRIMMWISIVTNHIVYFIYFLCTYVPLAIDPELPHNYSKVFPYYSAKWIINPSTDFSRNFQAIVHGSLGFYVAAITYLVTQAMFICSVQHTCGLFAIVAWIHLIEDLFNEMFFLTEVALLFCLGVLLFDIKYNLGNTRLVLRLLCILASFVLHIFYINYGGEQIRRYSSEIHSSTYFADWYLIPSKDQKMLLTIMQKCTRPFYLQIGIFILSMENFTMVLKASWSASALFFVEQKKKI